LGLRVILLPDVARLVSAYLRTVPEVAAIVGDRVYTVFPKQIGGEPFVLVTRIGGTPVVGRPRVVERATMQLDAYGGPIALAYQLAETCLQALAELEGEQPDELGNVCDVVALVTHRYVPDETWKPPRPRYVSDFEVVVKPAAALFAAA
jgi:hypothetical protein